MAKRVEVLKTYKLYIGGQFPRTESGRYYKAEGLNGAQLGNICLASRKDFRNAVVAARKGQDAWQNRSAFNRAQILYRIAEHLEARKLEMANVIEKEDGIKPKDALAKVEEYIDLIVYYAGWSDKFQQIFSSVNPVASSHFNFSNVEACGVVAIICDKDSGFKAFLNAIFSAICGGNTVIVLANEIKPLSAITLAEVMSHSDLPAGVVNILTGKKEEVDLHAAKHKDVNALLYIGNALESLKRLQLESVENLKRFQAWGIEETLEKGFESPYHIKSFLEVKTTWHPIEQIGGSSPAY